MADLSSEEGSFSGGGSFFGVSGQALRSPHRSKHSMGKRSREGAISRGHGRGRPGGQAAGTRGLALRSIRARLEGDGDFLVAAGDADLGGAVLVAFAADADGVFAVGDVLKGGRAIAARGTALG